MTMFHLFSLKEFIGDFILYIRTMIKISYYKLTCAVSVFSHANSELFKKSVALNQECKNSQKIAAAFLKNLLVCH